VLVMCVIALVCVIGIIGAVASTLGYDQPYGQGARGIALPPRAARRKRLRRASQQLRAVEAALVSQEPKPRSECSAPRTRPRSS